MIERGFILFSNPFAKIFPRSIGIPSFAMPQFETNRRGDIVFRQAVGSKAGVYFIAGFAGLLGVLFLVGGFSDLGADGAALIVLGALFVAFAWRFLRFTLGPYLMITDGALVADKFLRTRRWKFDDITALASFETMVQPPNIHHRKMSKVPVHFLGIRTREGKTSQLTLPSFRGNRDLLDLIAERSRLEIETIPDDEDAWKAWKQAKA